MIASFAGVFRGGERSALDAPVAALAGLSVAFIAFAAPSDVLTDLVGSTGLSSWIPAAEPPLGMKARFGLGAAGAIAMFAVVFLLLRWLDRVGTAGAKQETAAEELEVPRLRRRDFHPDASPRAPLLARLELGEPVEEEPETAHRFRFADDLPEEPDFLAEPPSAPAPSPEAIEAVEAVDAPEVDEAVEAPEASEAIPELMKRLEQGLARRRTSVEPTQITDPPVYEDDPAQDRLQSAIKNLQRLASRQS